MYGACIYDAANFVTNQRTDEQGVGLTMVYIISISSEYYLNFFSGNKIHELEYAAMCRGFLNTRQKGGKMNQNH